MFPQSWPSLCLSLLSLLFLLRPFILAAPTPTGDLETLADPKSLLHTRDYLQINDYSCRSTEHPNPVVMLHGLGATYYEDINYLQSSLQQRGYCTFSFTYGSYPQLPYFGGLQYIDASSQQIASFILQVKQNTGANAVDIVGHSEGAFQSLYVPKFRPGIAQIVKRIVAVAPPTNGTTFGGLQYLTYLLGCFSDKLVRLLLITFGCPACSDLLQNGPAVQKLNDGYPIIQPNINATIIMSKCDELVTPTSTFMVNETGVNNIYVQDKCPTDCVGHLAEGYDPNILNMIDNALSDEPWRNVTCIVSGAPAK